MVRVVYFVCALRANRVFQSACIAHVCVCVRVYKCFVCFVPVCNSCVSVQGQCANSSSRARTPVHELPCAKANALVRSPQSLHAATGQGKLLHIFTHVARQQLRRQQLLYHSTSILNQYVNQLYQYTSITCTGMYVVCCVVIHWYVPAGGA